MQFAGQVWFDFSSEPVWVFYRFARELAHGGAEVALEWLPLPNGRETMAMSTFVDVDDAADRGRFLHAMLGLVHLEDADPSSPATVERAAAEAGINVGSSLMPHPDLDDLTERAAELGVRAVPSLYRHGPVTHITLSGAALSGDITSRAVVMLAMADDDGIWSLAKP
jgi:hypothetical protein